MCKGIQGIFPVMIPAFYIIVYRPTIVKHPLILLSVSIITMIFIAGLISLSEGARNYFEGYYQARLYSTFNNPGTATVTNRFFLCTD
jgi:hypothetical protein